MDDPLVRYARQIIYPGFGESGQRALLAAHVTIIGVGATGSVLANHLARAGVGHLRLVDRDFVELNNLQRQLLYDEDDVAQVLPKAVAIAAKLRRINSAIAIEEIVADVNPTNIAGLIADADVVLDGTDNFATRYLINDACVKLGKPWVYCGCARHLRHDHDHPARRDAVPALHDGRAAGARHRAHLRYRRHHRPYRDADGLHRRNRGDQADPHSGRPGAVRR